MAVVRYSVVSTDRGVAATVKVFDRIGLSAHITTMRWKLVQTTTGLVFTKERALDRGPRRRR